MSSTRNGLNVERSQEVADQSFRLNNREAPRGIFGGFIALNNQNSTLMNYVSEAGDIMLMHETRIFYFNNTNQDNEEEKSQRTKPIIHNENGSNNLKKVTDDIRSELIGM